ncbi:MAG: fibronectin type III domain-containing protein [Clostridia bacterium]|nr:fibronectin type III domain-containing protein [Clostridia bacterium]
MKTTLKKISFLVALIAAAVVCFAFFASAVPIRQWDGDFWYEFDGEKVAVIGYRGNGGAVVVPDEFNGYPITVIGKEAFSGYYNGETPANNIKVLILPDTIKVIEKHAFYRVNASEGVEAVFNDDTLVANGSDLEIYISAGVEDIDLSAFICDEIIMDSEKFSGLKINISFGGTETQWEKAINKQKWQEYVETLPIVGNVRIDGYKFSHTYKKGDFCSNSYNDKNVIRYNTDSIEHEWLIESRTYNECKEGNTFCYICKICGQAKTETFMPGDHAGFVEKERKEPDCAREGYVIYECFACLEQKKEIFPATENHEMSWYSNCDATCIKDGTKTLKCLKCGGGKKQTVTDEYTAMGHRYSEWKIIQKATCTEKEVSRRVCSRCGEMDYKINKKLEHDYNAWKIISFATCAEKGISIRTCKRCADIDSKTVNSYEHTYQTITTKATLKKNGKTEIKCSVCGSVSKTTTIYYPKTIKLSATTYTYNNKTKTPSVTVKDSKGKTLKKGTDYTVTYPKKRKAIGKYTVTVTFKGNYSGTKKLTFEIVPAKVTLSKLTAGSKQLTAAWKTVSGATGYEVVYSTSKKFTKKTTKKVTIKKAKTKKTVIKKLKKGKKYYVKVRAYKTVGKAKIYGAYSKVKSVKVK